jgi:hypothetical protein
MKPFRFTHVLKSVLLGGQHEGLSAMLGLLSELNPDRERKDKFDEIATTSWKEFFTALEENCVELELTASLATVRKIRAVVATQNCSHTTLAPLHIELQGRLIDETDGKSFFALNIRQAELYSNPRKGWEEIIERFPDGVTDVEEASKCFALSRYAAAVFHSIQVVEVGLIELGKHIGVNDPRSGWTAVTNKLTAILKKKHDDLTDFEKRNFEFLEQIHGTIEGLKNAWRNKISHAQAKLTLMTTDFSPEVAEEMLFATRAFMRRLATDAPVSDS